MQAPNIKYRMPNVIKRPRKIDDTGNFYSNPQSKERIQTKTPPTPDLQYMKKRKMYDQVNHSVTNKSIHGNTEQDEEKYLCPSHPNKKAKYLLASNPSIHFCMKCAITMSEREPIIEYDKYYKLTQIQRFRNTIHAIKLVMQQKKQKNLIFQQRQKKYFDIKREQISSEFNQLVQLVKQKQRQIYQYMQKIQKQQKSTRSHHNDILNHAYITLDRYLQDVNKNYDDILSDLTVQDFDNIMQQYHCKITEYVRKVQKIPQDILQLQSTVYVESIKSFLINLQSFEELQIETEKQNNRNIENIEMTYRNHVKIL